MWVTSDPSKITDKVRNVLTSEAIKCVRIASAWEDAIKLEKNNLAKLVLKEEHNASNLA